MRGPFNAEGVHDFLLSISLGGQKLQLFPLNDMPTILPVEPWDGQDAKVSLEFYLPEEKFTVNVTRISYATSPRVKYSLTRRIVFLEGGLGSSSVEFLLFCIFSLRFLTG